MKRDFLSLVDLTPAEIEQILSLAIEIKQRHRRGELTPLLAGKSLALIFQKPSLRTRASFEVGMYQLGGYTTYLTPQDIGLGVREPIQDLGRVLSRYYDGIMLRTYAHDVAVDMARAASVPVINGLTDLLHPCQILAAMQTLREHFGHLKGLHVAYVGDGNNVANSWLLGAALMGMRLTIASPQGYQPDPAILQRAQGIAETTGASLWVLEDPRQGVQNADAIYTDVWASMGQEHEATERREVLRPYQVHTELLTAAQRHAVVMHCLPAHRGEEITEEVLESPQSLIFDEAENRLHAQKALLVFLLAQAGVQS